MTDWLPIVLLLVAVLALSVWRGAVGARANRERGFAGRRRARGAPPIREDSAGADDFGDSGGA